MSVSQTFHESIRNEIGKRIRAFKEGRSVRVRDPSPSISSVLYKLPLDTEGIHEYRVTRFARTIEEGILYRPAIVDHMKQVILDPKNRFFGTMVKGPQGIGKSHSLANLVYNLRSECHVVTFIPDCEKWSSSYDFVAAVCRSLGVQPKSLGISFYCSVADAEHIVSCVVDALETVNANRADGEGALHWFLVFDQVNRIFGRPEFQKVRDVGLLPRPFRFMKELCDTDNVHTVISASANNSVAYKENHEGFKEFIHPISMSREEVKIWKSMACVDLGDAEWTALYDATGLCPLQISEYLVKDPNSYLKESVGDVRAEVAKLWRETTVKEDLDDIAENAIRCLLSIPVNVDGCLYDKTYSLVSDGYLRPLFPAVLHAYRSFFWGRLMDYIDKRESDLLVTCWNPNVTNDTRERLFELIVISRFQKKNILAENPSEVVLPGMVDAGYIFESQKLPHPLNMDKHSLFIPKNSNFPAIDLILKEHKSVWAIQTHVSDHPDVAPKFKLMCEEQGWFKAFDDIFLVYLSPLPEATARLTCLPKTPSRQKRPRLTKDARPEIQVSALSAPEIACLKDLQWPSSEDMEIS